MRFIGVDLTDPYAAHPREVDVALLDEDGCCELATVSAGEVARDLATFTSPRAQDVLIIDGPLALAAAGQPFRECERMLRCAGKTPDVLPVPGTRPYAGFVRGSVELAARLAGNGWVPAVEGVSVTSATLLEAYPGCSWTVLAGRRLPRKTKCEGFEARADLLVRNGLRFRRAARTHDQLDAALCAWLAWTARRAPERTMLVGTRTYAANGHLREGAILQIVAAAGVRA